MSERSSPLKILFCCPVAVDPRLGAAKVYLEVASAFERLGWKSTLIGPDVWSAGSNDKVVGLRNYLRAHCSEYDVVEYEHTDLPFSRKQFPMRPILVARSVLLAEQVLRIAIPPRWRGARGFIGWLLRGRSRLREARQRAQAGIITCKEADLVNVANGDERALLVAHGIEARKVLVLPYGLTCERRAALAVSDVEVPASPRVAFVGTFDPRKGMHDFPAIVSHLAHDVPGVTFKLLGTAGMLRTAKDVYKVFPERLRSRVEVVPKFDPHELPGMLADCSVGVFPSYLEAFGFGVLEMLAAGLPVISYRAPGPPEMLPEEYLVGCGDAAGMAAKVSDLLNNSYRLRKARDWARARAAEFDWDQIVLRTAAEYARRASSVRSTGLAGEAHR